MNKIVSTDFITDDVQRLVPVDATATTPKNAAVAKLMKAWEAKTTQRTAKGAGLTLMALSLAACNDDSTTTAATPTTPTTPVTPAGQTFTLTSSVDAVVGTTANDTIAAGLINEGGVANVQTLGITDTIDGGAGTDVMTLTLSAGTTPLSVTNVETIQLTSIGALTHNFAAVTGMTTFSVVGNTGNTVVNNLAGIATVNMTSNAFNLTLDYAAAAVSGTADSQVVNLTTVTAGTLTLDAAIETVTLSSGGSVANTLTELAATGASTLTITGAQDLTITNTLGTSITTVAASAATGDLSILQTGAQISNITTGAGDDTIDLSGSFVDLTTTATADSVAGGLGADKLILEAAEAEAVGSAAQFANVTGIETVAIDDDGEGHNINLAFLGVTTLEFDSLVGAHTITAVSGNEVQFDAADVGNDARNYTIAGTGTSDTLTFDINGVDIGGGTQTLTGIESATFAVSGTSVLDGAIVMTATAATQTFIVTGTSGSFATGDITADVVNVGGYAGTFTTGTLQQATLYTGSTGADTVTGSSAQDIINVGAGADTIVSSDGDDTITLGAGADIIDFGNIEVGGAAAHNAGVGNTVTDFTAGTGGDVFDLDQLTAAGGYLETSNAITDIVAGTAYEVIVLGHVGFASVTAAEAAIAAQSTSATDAVIVFFDTTAGKAKVFFDADIDAAGTLTDTAVVAILDNFTSLASVQALVAGNFDIA